MIPQTKVSTIRNLTQCLVIFFRSYASEKILERKMPYWVTQKNTRSANAFQAPHKVIAEEKYVSKRTLGSVFDFFLVGLNDLSQQFQTLTSWNHLRWLSTQIHRRFAFLATLRSALSFLLQYILPRTRKRWV